MSMSFCSIPFVCFWGVPSSDILAVGSTVLAPLGGQFGNFWDPTSEHRLWNWGTRGALWTQIERANTLYWIVSTPLDEMHANDCSCNSCSLECLHDFLFHVSLPIRPSRRFPVVHSYMPSSQSSINLGPWLSQPQTRVVHNYTKPNTKIEAKFWIVIELSIAFVTGCI